MFERFTDRARRAVVIAEEEAKRYKHSSIRPGHLLLALAQGDGVAAKVIEQLGVSVDTLRTWMADAVDPAPLAEPLKKVPFSAPAKKCLELSLREALQLGHNYIGTEHILLGVTRESEREVNSAASVLGVDLDELRARVLVIVGRGRVAGSPHSPALVAALGRAHSVVGRGQVTTGLLLDSFLEDPSSQASVVLGALGVTRGAVASQMSGVDLAATSDAPPRPRKVEIKLGDTTTTIEDADVVAALGDLTPEELRAALQKAFGAKHGRRRAG
ncbi:MAG TPA: Clp protease N-terminal domain-containing protein [Acidimicrobiales bacterium]|nr:Clp protease N-terminal domain-containing protein [Acidimicrobiales bacterium]